MGTREGFSNLKDSMVLWLYDMGGCGAAGGSDPMAAPAAGMVTGSQGTGGLSP